MPQKLRDFFIFSKIRQINRLIRRGFAINKAQKEFQESKKRKMTLFVKNATKTVEIEIKLPIIRTTERLNQ